MNSQDQELSAMNAILGALQPLDAPAQVRVLRWAWQRFGDDADPHAAASASTSTPQNGDVAEVVNESGASNGPERALAVAYWLQEVSQRPSFTAQEVNGALKNLGHPVANITKTLESLKAQRPSLLMQVSKSGRSRQARKTYRLTAAGADRVRNILARANDEAAT